MELSIQERPKDLCMERGLMLEQLAEESISPNQPFLVIQPSGCIG